MAVIDRMCSFNHHTACTVVMALFALTSAGANAQEVFNNHPVVLDSDGKILPWYKQAEKASTTSASALEFR